MTNDHRGEVVVVRLRLTLPPVVIARLTDLIFKSMEGRRGRALDMKKGTRKDGCPITQG